MAHWHWHLCFHIWTSFRIQPLTYSIQNRLDYLRGRFPLSLAGETFSLSLLHQIDTPIQRFGDFLTSVRFTTT